MSFWDALKQGLVQSANNLAAEHGVQTKQGGKNTKSGLQNCTPCERNRRLAETRKRYGLK